MLVDKILHLRKHNIFNDVVHIMLISILKYVTRQITTNWRVRQLFMCILLLWNQLIYTLFFRIDHISYHWYRFYFIGLPIKAMDTYIFITQLKLWDVIYMMTSSNGNISRVTGPLWGESTDHRWFPLTKASDAGVWCFCWFATEKRQPNNRDGGDLRRHLAHYHVAVMNTFNIIVQIVMLIC